MSVNPVGGIPPSFGSWVERRRERIQAQLSALDDERFNDLATLIDADDEDRPPEPESEEDEREYRKMLADSEDLVRRLAKIRGRLLIELRDVERQQVSGPISESRRGRGGSLDGYL